MRFFRNALSVLLTSGATVPLGLVTSIVLARFLSVPDRGVYAVAASFTATLIVVFQFGWVGASIYRLRRVGSPPAEVLGAGLVAYATISLVVVGGGLLLETWIRNAFLEGAPARVFHLALAAVPPLVFGNLLCGIARGVDRFDLHNAYQIVEATGTLLAVASAMVLGSGGVTDALAAVLAFECALVLVFGVVVARVTGVSLRFHRDELIEGARFGLKNWSQWVSGNLHERLAVFLLAYLLRDPAPIAIYSIAVGVIQRIRIVPQAISAALFPRLVGAGDDDARAFTALVSRHSAFWVGLSIAALAPTASILLPLLYGRQYEASVPLFLVLLPAMGMLTVYNVVSNYFSSLGRQGVNVTAQIVSTAVNVALNLWWIPRFGATGAAWSCLISYGLAAAFVVTAFLRESGGGPGSVLLIRRDDFDAYWRRLRPLAARIGVGTAPRAGPGPGAGKG